MRRSTLFQVWLPVAFLALIPFFAIYLQKPPAIVPATAPANVFSAERAMIHVRKIAQKPHPMRSEESEKVRGYLVDQMNSLGLSPEQLISTTYPGITILGVLRGTSHAQKALMLSAHYDSRSEGPGAGDDASGVAAILETVRALQAGPKLDNDVVILFTDGEELGLTGALTFVESRSRRQRVGLVINFEARGSRGPSYLFETSIGNAWMIRQFARAAPYPIASSLTGAVYRSMPNSTDLAIFKSMGLNGLNFAFIDGYENYHRESDTAENLDLKSLQHQGSYALALAQQFGKLDLRRVASGEDAIYFHVFGPHLIVYSERFAIPLMAVTLIGFGAAMMLGLRAKRITERGVVRGAGFGLVVLLMTTAITYGCWEAMKYDRPMGPKGQGSPELAVGLMVLGLAISVALYWLVRKRFATLDLTLGALFIFLVLTVYTSLNLTGGSYIFLWPTLFGVSGVIAQLIAKDDDGIVARSSLFVGSAPALILFPPTMQSLCAALGPNLPFVPATVASLLVLALLPLILCIFGRTEQPKTEEATAQA